MVLLRHPGQKQRAKIDWESYVNQYAEFIVKYNVRYFELDIDPIVGLNEVERLRLLLETRTEKMDPVWHKKLRFRILKMCKNYDYVAIGGIVT